MLQIGVGPWAEPPRSRIELCRVPPTPANDGQVLGVGGFQCCTEDTNIAYWMQHPETTRHIKQLLDEVEHDIMNYQNRGLCYLPKPKAEADNTDARF